MRGLSQAQIAELESLNRRLGTKFADIVFARFGLVEPHPAWFVILGAAIEDALANLRTQLGIDATEEELIRADITEAFDVRMRELRLTREGESTTRH